MVTSVRTFLLTASLHTMLVICSTLQPGCFPLPLRVIAVEQPVRRSCLLVGCVCLTILD